MLLEQSTEACLLRDIDCACVTRTGYRGMEESRLVSIQLTSRLSLQTRFNASAIAARILARSCNSSELYSASISCE